MHRRLQQTRLNFLRISPIPFILEAEQKRRWRSYLRVVIAHDFIRHGGAERVLEHMHALWPRATIWTLYQEQHEAYEDWDIRSSWLQPLVTDSKYRWPMPLYQGMVDRLAKKIDWKAVDLLVTSSVSFMKNLQAPVGIPHLCYIHRPAMFAYDRQDMFLSGYPKMLQPVLRNFCTRFRAWDQQYADNPDLYLTNSDYIGQMVKQIYRCDSETLYPPVRIESFREAGRATEPGDYYFAAVRLESYKRMELVVQACNELALKLKIAGIGPMFEELKTMAGPTVEMLGYVSDDQMLALMAGCKAFILPSEEDFGIAPVEAMASGRPVVALGRAGLLETVADAKSGIHFDEQCLADVIDAIKRCESQDWDAEVIRKSAERFSSEHFESKLLVKAEKLLAKLN